MENREGNIEKYLFLAAVIAYLALYFFNTNTKFRVVNDGYPTVGKVVSIHEESRLGEMNRNPLVYTYDCNGTQSKAMKHVPKNTLRRSNEIVGKSFLVFYKEYNNNPKAYIFLNNLVTKFDKDEIVISRHSDTLGFYEFGGEWME